MTRPRRRRPAARCRTTNLPCCSSISTASRSSTTRSAIGSATCCCRRWRSGCKQALRRDRHSGPARRRRIRHRGAVVRDRARRSKRWPMRLIVSGRAALRDRRPSHPLQRQHRHRGRAARRRECRRSARWPPISRSTRSRRAAAAPIKFYEQSMNKELNDRRQIEMDLREAIERNELELHYQPIIDLRRNVDHRLRGAGALAPSGQGHGPAGGVHPGGGGQRAHPAARRMGAARKRAARRRNGRAICKIAVNLSPVQFSAPNLVDTIERMLAETGLAPHRLELEITERIFMDEQRAARLSTLHRLKDLGVRISMDDFGTGYSSLSYLRSFPFDKIKVDRTFVSDLADRHRARRHRAGGGQHRARARHDDHGGRRRDRGPAGVPDGARLRRGAGLSVQRAGPDREGSRDHRRVGGQKTDAA